MPGPKLTQNKGIIPFLKAVAATKKVQRVFTFRVVPAQLPRGYVLTAAQRRKKNFPCLRMEL